MKQVFQDVLHGRTEVIDVPAPAPKTGHLVIQTQNTLISAGTERMLVDFSRAGFLNKARQQPEKVKMVLNKVKTDGLLSTVDAVRSKLDQPLPMGYSNVGTVIGVGAHTEGFAIGDRVLSNGPHAEIVRVGRNLCAKIPDNVSNEAATYAVVGSIGLQGVRLAMPTLGECFVVIGLGLIGLMTVQILRASGCRVLGVDFDSEKIALAKKFGAEVVNPSAGESLEQAALLFSRQQGVDGVLITASTKSAEPVHQAATVCRKRGRIVLVGVVGLELDRSDFYEKELSFQVSCSYGPGRYDADYEEKGHDYPIGFVRWTEQRNFEAVLDMMASGQINVDPLTTHRFSLNSAGAAYDMLAAGEESCLGLVLDYEQSESAIDVSRTISTNASDSSLPASIGQPTLGVIGAGNYASRVLIPALEKSGARLGTVAGSGGQAAASVARKFGFDHATTDTQSLLTDSEIDTVVIATRHDSHAALTCAALEAGKNVFVEKPLGITTEEINAIEAAYGAREGQAGPRLMVGFNRRFSPHIVEMKSRLDSASAPKTLVATVNAGELPADHWTQDSAVGGGRIIGEACHFIDLLRFLIGSPISAFQAMCIGSGAAVTDDKATITLSFDDGSIGTIHYFANGHSAFPKERIEAFCGGNILQLDNFRRLRGYGWPAGSRIGGFKQDKGQEACAAAFVDSIRQGLPSPIDSKELFEVARVTIDVATELRGSIGAQ